MKCPHCNTGIHEGFSATVIVDHGGAPPSRWVCKHQKCPECQEAILVLQKVVNGVTVTKDFMAYPQSVSRPIATEVVDPYRSDFIEACKVLPLSPKASAALSRRCLQAILRNMANTKSKDLLDQIEEVSAPGILPSHIVDDLHAVRNIGNFAAHMMKSTKTGEIIDVEPGEAEWNLDVLESLFDFYFVQPALSAKRKMELNKKLKEAGKPEIK